MSEPLLSIEGVAVDLPTPRGRLRAVDGVDLRLEAGQTLGVVGESGCGKTMLSRAILQLLPKRARLSGRVMFNGRDLAGLPAEARSRLYCSISWRGTSGQHVLRKRFSRRCAPPLLLAAQLSTCRVQSVSRFFPMTAAMRRHF